MKDVPVAFLYFLSNSVSAYEKFRAIKSQDDRQQIIDSFLNPDMNKLFGDDGERFQIIMNTFEKRQQANPDISEQAA